MSNAAAPQLRSGDEQGVEPRDLRFGGRGAQEVGLARAGRPPKVQGGLAVAGQPNPQRTQQLGVAPGREVVQCRRGNRRQVEQELLHSSQSPRSARSGGGAPGLVTQRMQVDWSKIRPLPKTRRRGIGCAILAQFFRGAVPGPSTIRPNMSEPRPGSGLTYAQAGVDIDAGDALVENIKPLARRTLREGVLAGIGGFGALFEVPKKYRNPVLVSGTDGVGTKLKLAFELEPPRHHRHRPGGDERQRHPGAGRRAAVLPRLLRLRQARRDSGHAGGGGHRPRLRAAPAAR